MRVSNWDEAREALRGARVIEHVGHPRGERVNAVRNDRPFTVRIEPMPAAPQKAQPHPLARLRQLRPRVR